MRLPKYVGRLIELRIKYAEELNAVDTQLSEWLEQHDIEVDSCDTRGGCEMYANPDESAERIRNAIMYK